MFLIEEKVDSVSIGCVFVVFLHGIGRKNQELDSEITIDCMDRVTYRFAFPLRLLSL